MSATEPWPPWALGFPVIFLFTSLFSGIATGGTVVIAQSFGGGRPDRVRSAIDSLYTAFIRSILPITAAALLLVNPLMTVLRVDPAAWAETRTYLLVVCAGLVGSIGYNLNAGILGGMGNSSTTLLFLAVSTILNIFLDLALVLAVPLGVLGVALGTVVAQLCSWLFGIWYINRRYPQLAIHPFNGIFDRKLFCEIIRHWPAQRHPDVSGGPGRHGRTLQGQQLRKGLHCWLQRGQ